MSVSSRSAPATSPAATSSAMTAGTTIRDESSSSRPIFRVKESILKKWQLERDMRKEAKAEEQLYRNEMRKEMMDTTFKPEPFGDTGHVEQTPDPLLMSSVVSIALFNGDVLVYACSGTAVRHWHGNIKDFHTIFVTSARLAQKFNDNRTRDDNLRIEVRTYKNKTLHGFLGLYDEKNGIAIVTSFSLKCVYTMDTSNPVDLPRSTIVDELFTFGCAMDGTLMRMRAVCFPSVFEDTSKDTSVFEDNIVFEDKSLVSLDCKITGSGLGGPVMIFSLGGSARMAGIIVDFCEDKITLLPRKKLHNWLQNLLEITSKTSHFCGYSLPEGVETVIPSGFMVESKILQSLGYPLPPPLLFELNGRLAGGFEEHFGQLHYWEGYPFDFSYDYGTNPIWDQLGETLAREISQSVVSVASLKDNKRCFACTGLLITGRDCMLVLTSASLVRIGDAEGEIDEKLKIEVFLPRNHIVEGMLELYHQNYNIAIVRLKHDFPIATCPQDILNVRETRNRKSVEARGLRVVAIGRATKASHGLLMASMGEVKGKYKAVKNKWSTGLAKKPDCQDLLLSTCQIKKVGIGGPLIGLDGSFIGMNFYDESGTTPFLPRKEILAVLRQGFDLLESSTSDSRPVNMEDIPGQLSSKTLKRKRNKWPVAEPYWFLAGQVDPLDRHVGKVLM